MTSSESTAVKERPILFRGPMVKAILDGRKTQTRRIMKPQPELLKDGKVWKWNSKGYDFVSVVIPPSTNLLLRAQGRPGGPVTCLCPYGAPGDRLWVRETWAPIPEMKPSGYFTDPKWKDRTAWYAADNDKPMWGGNWKPSIHMPRKFSRITLEIVSVRVERLQAISDRDIQAEGFTDSDATPACVATAECYGMSVLRHRFSCLWERINGAGSWDANSWVWCVEFKRI